jgi:hypothetical protein
MIVRNKSGEYLIRNTPVLLDFLRGESSSSKEEGGRSREHGHQGCGGY